MSLHDISPIKEPSWVKKKRKRKRDEWRDNDLLVKDGLLVPSTVLEENNDYQSCDSLKLCQNVVNDGTLISANADVIFSRKNRKKKKKECSPWDRASLGIAVDKYLRADNSDHFPCEEQYSNSRNMQQFSEETGVKRKKHKRRTAAECSQDGNTSVVVTRFLKTYDFDSTKLSQISCTAKHKKRHTICEEESEQKDIDVYDFKASDVDKIGNCRHTNSSQELEKLSSFSTSDIFKSNKHKHGHRKLDSVVIPLTPKRNQKSVCDDQRDLIQSYKLEEPAVHKYIDTNDVYSGRPETSLADENLNSTVAVMEPRIKRKKRKPRKHREVFSELVDLHSEETSVPASRHHDDLLSSTSHRKHSKHKRLNRNLKKMGCDSQETDALFCRKSQTSSLPIFYKINCKKSEHRSSELNDDFGANHDGLHVSSPSNYKTRHSDCISDDQYKFMPKSEPEHFLVENSSLLHRKRESHLPEISLDHSNSSESCKMKFPDVIAVKNSKKRKTELFPETSFGPVSKHEKHAAHKKKRKPSKEVCDDESNFFLDENVNATWQTVDFAVEQHEDHAKHKSRKLQVKNVRNHCADNIAVDVNGTQTTTEYRQLEDSVRPTTQFVKLEYSPCEFLANVKTKKRKKHKHRELEFEVAVKSERSREESFNNPQSDMSHLVENEKPVKHTKRRKSKDFSSELLEPNSVDINKSTASKRHTLNLNAAEYINLEEQAHKPEVFNLKTNKDTSGAKSKVATHFDPIHIVSSSAAKNRKSNERKPNTPNQLKDILDYNCMPQADSANVNVDKELLLNSVSSPRQVKTAKQKYKVKKCFDESYADAIEIIPTKSLKPAGNETSPKVADVNCVMDESADIRRKGSCMQPSSEVKGENVDEPLHFIASESCGHDELKPNSSDDLSNASHSTVDLKPNDEDSPKNSVDLAKLQINIFWPLSELHKETLKVIKEDRKRIMKKQGIRYKEGHWTEEEEATLFRNWSEFQKEYKVSEASSLLSLARKYGDVKRKFILYLGKGLDDRPLIAIYHKIRQRLKKTVYSGRLTYDEEAKLKSLVKTHGPHWQHIGKEMNRNPTSLQILYNRAVRQFKYSGRWNPEEDAKLIDIIKFVVGEDSFVYMNKKTLTNLPWEKIGSLHGTRNGKQCRDRWLNQLYGILSEKQNCRWDEATTMHFLEILSQATFKNSFDVNWVKLAKKLRSMTPGQLQMKWYQLKAKLAINLGHATFEETVDYVLSCYRSRLVPVTET